MVMDYIGVIGVIGIEKREAYQDGRKRAEETNGFSGNLSEGGVRGLFD